MNYSQTKIMEKNYAQENRRISGQREDALHAGIANKKPYTVNYTEYGVYLEKPKEAPGVFIPANEYILYDLSRRNINGFNIADTALRLRRNETSIRLADPQKEKPSDMEINIKFSPDEMSATMMLYPAVNGGNRKTVQEILDILRKKWGITNGVKTETIAKMVEEGCYGTGMEIAAGRKPQRGKDGYLTFLFKTVHSCAPKILDDGSIDNKNLDLFESIAEGTKLVVLNPPEPGIEGCSVKGRIIPAQQGMEAKLPKGKNVRVSDDGLSLIAAKSGRVDYSGGRVDVSDVYVIQNDVDLHVGNVQFEGNIVIYGNINSGMTVQASGSIEVYGSVEAATLIAGKDIILKSGMGGSDKGELKAGGNIIAGFLERCHADAGENIFSGYIINSIINAGKTVSVKGKRGKLIGGEIRAGESVTARIIGSPSGDSMVIEVGVLPELRMKLAELETQRNQMKQQMDKMDNLMRVPASHDASSERKAIRQKLVDTRAQLTPMYEAILENIENAKQEIALKSGGQINAYGTVYPDVKLVINSCKYTVRSTTEYVTYKYRDGQVIFTSCEIQSN